MKSITKAILVGGFMLAAQAAVAAGSAFPAGSEEYWGLHAPQSTFAAEHAADVAKSDASSFPQGSVQYWDIPPHSYYSDAHANDPVKVTGSAIPLGSEQFWDLPPHNTATTRADQLVNNPTQLSQSPNFDDASGK